jgi:hypothetical protein
MALLRGDLAVSIFRPLPTISSPAHNSSQYDLVLKRWVGGGQILCSVYVQNARVSGFDRGVRMFPNPACYENLNENSPGQRPKGVSDPEGVVV